MRSILYWVRTKVNLAAVMATVLLIGFIGFLVVANYVAQCELRKSTLDHLRLNIEKHAAAVSYFLSERKNDLKDLAESRTISTFFENRALGMSMEYGLKVSLLGISESFDRLLTERKIEEDRIYTRIVFIDSHRELLADRAQKTAKQERELDWDPLLTPESLGQVIIDWHDGQEIKIIVSIPCFFKYKYIGHVVAWISPRTVYSFIQMARESSKHSVYIICRKHHIPIPTDMQSGVVLSSLPDFRNFKSGKAHLFEAVRRNGDKVHTVALRVAVKNTPLFLVALVPVSELFGPMALWHLPCAMGVLAIILLVGTVIIFRVNTQNLVLCARLEESSKREQEIEEKRRLLEKEIVERKQAEEALKESHKELRATQEQLVRHEKLAVLGQLAGSVGHELRNPLGVISNAVYFLQMNLSEADETTREYLEIISSEVGNADTIVSDLMDFSRIKAVEREETDVSGLVSQVLEKQPTPENVEVTIAIPPDLAPVFIDPKKIGQVLSNLVANACQAMPAGGKLTISAHAEKEKVSLTITDTGCGISKENMKNIYEPLFTTKARGIGLGLSVSKSIVEANGGSIKAESEEGKGSTFTLILPTREAVS